MADQLDLVMQMNTTNQTYSKVWINFHTFPQYSCISIDSNMFKVFMRTPRFKAEVKMDIRSVDTHGVEL